jgi:hypothetical protein
MVLLASQGRLKIPCYNQPKTSEVWAMKRLLMVGLLLAGCAERRQQSSEEAPVEITDKKVKLDSEPVRPVLKAAYQWGIKEVRVNDSPATGKTNGLFYSDDLILVRFVFFPEYIGFVLENRGDKTFRLVWDESVFIKANGSNSRIVHSGIKLIDAEKPQPPSIVTSGGKIDEGVWPTDYLSFEDGKWRHQKIVPDLRYDSFGREASQFRSEVQSVKGADLFGLFLTLQTSTGKREYLFRFHVASAEVIEPNTNR